MALKKITRALVVANEKKHVARQIKKEVQSFLFARGIKISPVSPQLIITVGGDGTVLFSKKHYGTSFFSIGSKTSFICQADFSDWKKKLSKALRSKQVEQRLLLEATLNGKKLPLSLNEIGIRNPEPRILSMHLQVGSRHFAFRADGVFFSTPTGSPAYCYSCGGKEMKKSANAYQVVAIAPFRRQFKPTIIAASSQCTLRISAPDKAHLFVDGQPAGTFSEKQTLKIRGNKKKFLFVKI
ncbi:MAG: hypothetical protein NTV88_00540 [Candidatus Micrarchaeota archaeon]|nr:hypothetical protein [Candidatus Micrarchaeota archaeon]